MAAAMSRARKEICTSFSRGLATVKSKAEVSPKLPLNCTGPAPVGRESFKALRRRLISLKTCLVSVMVSSRFTWTMETPGRSMT